ncbi:PH domain-containing protein [Microbacteriaceae bacterium VKM Ac-2855]|nr:PH domain-containing protein [Microbacteriaceae bacterium VKM Ac-2855]
MPILDRWFDPNIDQYLIADEGEVVIDEVRRHWMAIVGPLARLFVALMLLFLAIMLNSWVSWIALALSVGVAAEAGYRILALHMDRFVITNIRVFRVHGVFDQHLATMPMSRILDVAVHKPLIGRILGYGHFVFESAAQGQGLRDIRYVGDPNERDLSIQRAIQRSGVRGRVGIDTPQPQPQPQPPARSRQRPPGENSTDPLDLDW